MIIDSSSTSQQRPRSFSEVITVYQKLVRFYLYNFFLQKQASMLASIYFGSLVIPLFVSLLQSQSPWLKDWARPKIRKGDQSFLVSFLFFLHDLLPSRGSLFYILHVYLFLLGITALIRSNFLYFLERKAANDEAGVQEELVISSVAKIKTYDIFFFEVAFLFLLHFLHFTCLLILSPLVRSSNKDKFDLLEPLRISLLVYFASLSSSDVIASIFLSLLLNFEFSLAFTGLKMEAIRKFDYRLGVLIEAIRILLLLSSLLRIFYSSRSKVRKLRS